MRNVKYAEQIIIYSIMDGGMKARLMKRISFLKKCACFGDETMRCRGDTVIVVVVVDMNRQWALALFDLLRIVIFLQLYLR